MRLAYLLPGSGGSFYCENCSRDLLVTSALREAGCELHTVPLYLPLYGLGPEIGDHPVFFGGVKTWLREHLPPLRHAPRWLDALLDSDLLLRLAASRAGSTSARDLGPMTNSMLLGDRGPHRGEAHRLAAWLADLRPDVVHLSNALLLGLAPAIKERTGAAIVCSLQDEAEWVEAMAGAWPETVWRTMAEQAGAVDAFVAVSRPYAERVAPRLGLDPRRIGVLPLGVAVDSHPQATPGEGPPVLGYLARASEAEGLGVLVEAFLRLREEHPELRLQVMGGWTSEDRPLLDRVERTLRGAGARDAVDFLEGFHHRARLDFLASLSLLSVPGTAGAAFGLGILEALASGVPVVQPERGAVGELVRATGGGLLYDPGDPEGLVGALDRLLREPGLRAELGARGRAGVKRHYALDTMVQRLTTLYRELVP